MTQEEKKQITRRNYLKYVGAGVVVVGAAAAAAYYATLPPSPPTTLASATTSEVTTAATSAVTSTAAPSTYATTIDVLAPPWAGLPPEEIPLASQAAGANVNDNVIDYEALRDRIASSLATKVAPGDVTEVDSLWVNGYKDAWEPLEGKYALSDADRADMDYLLKAQPWYNEDGKLLAIPYSCDFSLLSGNRNMLEKAGYTDWPKTFEELKNICQDIVTKGICDRGFEIGVGANSGTPWMFWPIAQAFGGQWFDADNNPLWDDRESGNVKALQWLHDAIWKWKIMPKAALTDWNEVGDLFSQEKIGVIEITISAAPSYDAAPDKYPIAGHVDEFLFPSGTPELKYGPSTFGTEGVGICRYSAPEKKDAGFRYMKWLTSTETEVRMAKAIAITPPRKSAMKELVASGFWAKKYGDVILPALDTNKGFCPRGPPAWFPEFWLYLGQVVNLCCKDSISAYEAMHRAAEAVRGYKKKYGA
jgi:multiple sugar transport system substrate-binding protein